MQNGSKVCQPLDRHVGELEGPRRRRQERTEWHRIVIFNENLITVAEKYLQKGARSTSRASSKPGSGRTRR